MEIFKKPGLVDEALDELGGLIRERLYHKDSGVKNIQQEVFSIIYTSIFVW